MKFIASFLPTITAMAAVSGCQQSEPTLQNNMQQASNVIGAAPFERVEPNRKNAPANGTMTNLQSQEGLKLSADYDDAIRCWSLTEVVATLVNADIIRDRRVAARVGRVSGKWKDSSVTIGLARGMTPSMVQADFDRDQDALLAPLKTLPQDEATDKINDIVHSAGDCGG